MEDFVVFVGVTVVVVIVVVVVGSIEDSVDKEVFVIVVMCSFSVTSETLVSRDVFLCDVFNNTDVWFLPWYKAVVKGVVLVVCRRCCRSRKVHTTNHLQNII